MFRTRTFSFAAAVLCMLGVALSAAAAEVDCDSVYCFAADDFTADEAITGICVTGLPDGSVGMLQLGGRQIRSGDILTADQVAQMTFSPAQTGVDRIVCLEYLPIHSDRVAPCTAMTIRIRGKEDHAPVAEDLAAETYKNIPITAKLKVSDPEEQTMTFAVTRQPKRGTVELLEDGSFTYTPKKNKVGVDSFTYTAADPAGNVSREATVTVTILKPGDAVPYTDTAGRECQFTAEWMKNTGIFTGERFGRQPCFQPDKTVTRGEFVTMLVKALDIPTDAHLTYTGYSDEIPTWLQPYLAAAIRSGMTAGLPDQDVFGANKLITGAEAAVLLRNALDLTGSQPAMAAEGSAVPDWAASALNAVQQAGFSLEADMPLTREAAAGILYRSAQYAASLADNNLM